jgi:CHAT domain-containing protein
MAWAMFVAGARATVASQWKVESKSTTRMMIEFHRRLLNERAISSQAKAEALRRAQINLLRDSHYGHPYYWSPFVLVAAGW